MNYLYNNLIPLNTIDNTLNIYILADYIINKYNLKDLIQNIKFINSDTIYGYYDPKELAIYLNTSNDFYMDSFIKSIKDFNYYDFTEYKNSQILLTLIHELRHSFQQLTDLRDYKKQNKSVYSHIVSDFITLDDKQYDLIYDTNPLEKDAEITAYETLINILNIITNNKRIISYYTNDYYEYKLKEGYINNSFSLGSLELNYKNILNNIDKYILIKPLLQELNPFDKIKINEKLNEQENNYILNKINKSLIK